MTPTPDVRRFGRVALGLALRAASAACHGLRETLFRGSERLGTWQAGIEARIRELEEC